jgi:hypothetical protein
MASPDLVILVSSGSQGRPDLPDSLKKHQCLQDCERDVRWEFLKDLGVTGLVAGGCGVLALAITSANPIAGALAFLVCLGITTWEVHHTLVKLQAGMDFCKVKCK